MFRIPNHLLNDPLQFPIGPSIPQIRPDQILLLQQTRQRRRERTFQKRNLSVKVHGEEGEFRSVQDGGDMFCADEGVGSSLLLIHEVSRGRTKGRFD